MAVYQESGAIRVRRIYVPPDGGYRVLVDRLCRAVVLRLFLLGAAPGI